MAQTPDITAILAALAAQNQAPTPAQPAHSPFPNLPQPGAPNPLAGIQLPPPSSTGGIDLNAIKPVSSGSVSFNDAIAKAKAIALENGINYDTRAASRGANPSYTAGAYSGYGRRSRSRSPRRDRDSYNPYRDERRGQSIRSPSPVRSPRARYGRERTPPRGGGGGGGDGGSDSEVLTIDSRMVGLIIGRNGENLRRVEQDTGARVQFITGPDGGARRQCRISGTLRQREDAKRELMRTIDDNGGNSAQAIQGAGGVNASSGRGGGGRGSSGSGSAPPPVKDGENSVQIMVPDRTVGLIIGRGGETIRDLQEKSDCHINIVGENQSVNGFRPVNLIGSAQACSKAREYIDDIVESDTRTNGQAQPSRGAPDPLSAPDPMKITENIHVPSSAVGMIIGRGGETVKDMQNQTQCKINIFPPSGADVERKIELIGFRRSIDDAKATIWRKVSEAGDKNGGGRGGRGGGRDGGRDRDRDRDRDSDRYGSNDAYQPSGANATPMSQPQPSAGGDGSADPYAAWGGYQNYYTIWYNAMQQQAQQGGKQQPPGPGAPPS